MSSCCFNFFARSLNFRTDVKVVLPEYEHQRDAGIPGREAYDPDVRFPAVYLLHGFTGDSSDWFQMIPIERYAQEYGFAIVMPNAYNSWYMNLPAGPKVETFIAKELPASMEALLPISGNASQRFIAGLSMGGTGAVQTALKYPDQYRAMASASGVMSRELLREQYGDGSPDSRDMLDCLDYAYPKACPDMEELYLGLKKSGSVIPEHLFLYGTEDEMFSRQYARFVAFAEKNSLPVIAEKSPGGHDFMFWDPAIRRILGWFRTMIR